MDATQAKTLLEAKRGDLDEEITRISDVPRDPTAVIGFGKRVGDGTTEAVERLSATATADELNDLREQVVHALARLEADTWGYCEKCGDEISAERLEAIPWATLCITCASAR